MTSKNKLFQRIRYVSADYLASSAAFIVFNVARFHIDGHNISDSLEGYLTNTKVLLEEIFLPLILLGVYWISGYYNHVLGKSRVEEFITTLISAVFNTTLIMCALTFNDFIGEEMSHMILATILFLSLFSFTYIGRYFITSFWRKKETRSGLSSPTIIVGNTADLIEVLNGINRSRESVRNQIVGISILDNESSGNFLAQYNHVNPSSLTQVCKQMKIKEVIVAMSQSKNKEILDIIDTLFPLDIHIRIKPDTLSIITSSISLSDVYGIPLVNLTAPACSDFTCNLKRSFDFLASVCALILLSPALFIIGALVKKSSPGPVIYSQERLGLRKRPFKIFKFRTMVADAEKFGPSLSSEDDPRITKIGHFLRKYRIDELPQFWNVIRGDMSLVGPRPEREFFVKKIVEIAPYYNLVFQIKPGITSWGMVMYGYASDLKQMVERTKYDLIYISNMSLSLDFKIIIYTFRTIFKGLGM